MANLELPVSQIQKILKSTLSDKMMVARDVRVLLSKIGGLFALANDVCKENKRVKIMPRDVLIALKEMGFDEYIEELEEYIKNKDNTKVNEVSKKRKIEDDNITNSTTPIKPDPKKHKEDNDDNEEEEEEVIDDEINIF